MPQKRNLKEQILSLKDKGLNYSEISKKLNCSTDSVSYYLNPETRIKKNILKKKIRNKNKNILVSEHGGACKICSYNKYPVALQFHHLVPEDKELTISGNATQDLEKMRKESKKCVLLCANCHAEVEAKVNILPEIYLNEYLKLKNDGYWL
jgi:5-methylcytosine-specific restriction endonuclease McrA